MKYIQTYKIFEASSLTKIGVPREVMQQIQRDYEIPVDAKWERIPTKDEIKNILKEDRCLIIEMAKSFISVITNNNSVYTTEIFTYDDNGWGSYEKKDRRVNSFTQTFNSISSKNLLWYLVDNRFEVQAQPIRREKREQMKFDTDTFDFKIKIVQNFNRLLKKMYGAKHDKISDTIYQKISSVPMKMNQISGKDWEKELFDLIDSNEKLKKLADQYKKMRDENDILGLEKLEKQYNSLTIFDEYLIEFEVMYSEEFNAHLTIRELINGFGLDKIMTAFMYYLYTGKKMSLKMEKHK